MINGDDLVAECAAHAPRRIALLQRGTLVGLLWHGLMSLDDENQELDPNNQNDGRNRDAARDY